MKMPSSKSFLVYLVLGSAVLGAASFNIQIDTTSRL